MRKLVYLIIVIIIVELCNFYLFNTNTKYSTSRNLDECHFYDNIDETRLRLLDEYIEQNCSNSLPTSRSFVFKSQNKLTKRSISSTDTENASIMRNSQPSSGLFLPPEEYVEIEYNQDSDAMTLNDSIDAFKSIDLDSAIKELEQESSPNSSAGLKMGLSPGSRNNYQATERDNCQDSGSEHLTNIMKHVSSNSIEAFIRRATRFTTTRIGQYNVRMARIEAQIRQKLDKIQLMDESTDEIERKASADITYYPAPITLRLMYALARYGERLYEYRTNFQFIENEHVSALYRVGNDPIIILSPLPDVPFFKEYVSQTVDLERGIIYIQLPFVRLDRFELAESPVVPHLIANGIYELVNQVVSIIPDSYTKRTVVLAQSFGTIVYGWLTNYTRFQCNRTVLIDPVATHLLTPSFQNIVAFEQFNQVCKKKSLNTLLFWMMVHSQSLQKAFAVPPIDGILMLSNISKITSNVTIIYGMSDPLISSDLNLLLVLAPCCELLPMLGGHGQHVSLKRAHLEPL